ncbi:hypothetical protein ACP4OV_007336 [Aristida adscensionis]
MGSEPGTLFKRSDRRSTDSPHISRIHKLIFGSSIIVLLRLIFESPPW